MGIVEQMIADKQAQADRTKDARLRNQLLNDIEWLEHYLATEGAEKDDDDQYTHLGETYEG